jgi:hypothetical protein
MQAEEVQDHPTVQAPVSPQQAELEEQQCWQVLADLLAVYSTTVLTAKIMLTEAEVVAALITL